MAGALAPDGKVFEHGGVVADDFEDITGGKAPHLAEGEEHGEGAEEAEDVEGMERHGGEASRCGR